MKVKSKGHMALLIGSTAVYALTSVAEILIAVLTGRIVDSAIASQLTELFSNGVILIFLILVQLLASWIGFKAHARFTKQGLVHMKEALLQALFRRRTKEFKKKDDAYYINLLNADMSILQNEYYRNLPFLVYSIAQAVLAAMAILHMDVWMFFASIFLALFPMLITNFFADGLRRRRNAVSKANEDYLIMNLIFSMEHITRIVIGYDWAQDFLDRFDGVIHIESYNPREDIIE